MRIIRNLALGLLLTGGWVVLAAAEPAEKVGEWGDYRRLVVQGATSFPADNVKNGLAGNLDLRFAAHPAAPLSEYLRLLQEKAVAGYQQAGFPKVEARAEVHRDERKIEIKINEGPRQVAAGIQIVAVDKSVRETLERALTSRWPRADAHQEIVNVGDGKSVVRWVDGDGTLVELNEPLWQPGKPANFFVGYRKLVRDRIDRTLEELGYYGARYDIDLIPDGAHGTALLMVRLTDLGPTAIVGGISVVGNSKNSREAVLNYLELKPGMPINARQGQQMRERLWASARFLASDIRLVSEKRESVDVLIHLTEYSKAPPLSEPLTREEQVLLKARQWLADPDHWQGDLVVRTLPPSPPIKAIVSPHRGTLLSAEFTTERSNVPIQQCILVATSHELGIYRPSVRRKIVGNPPSSGIKISLGIGPSGDPEKPFSFSFGAWTEGGDGKTADIPVQAVFKFHPCAFLAFAHEHNAKCAWSGNGVLTTEDEISQWKIDAASGRLREGRLRKESNEPWTVQIEFKPNALQDELKAVAAASASYKNECQADEPGFVSLLRFLVTDDILFDLYHKQPPDARARAALLKLFDKAVLPWLNSTDTPDANKKGEEFKAPDELATRTQAKFAPYVLFVAEGLFPRDSWPWTLACETAWAYLGKTEYTDYQLRRFWAAEETGPLGHLAAAHLPFIGPDIREAFAARGLQKLRKEQLRHDCRFLWEGDDALPKCMDALAKAVCVLDEEECRALMTLLPPEDAVYAAEGIRVLREKRNRPIAESLPAALDAMWLSGLQTRVQTVLTAAKKRDDLPRR